MVDSISTNMMRSMILKLKPEPGVGYWYPDWFPGGGGRLPGFLQWHSTVFNQKNKAMIAACFEAGRRKVVDSDNPLEVVLLGVTGGIFMLYIGFRISKWILGSVWRIISYPFRKSNDAGNTPRPTYGYFSDSYCRNHERPSVNSSRKKKNKSKGPPKKTRLQEALKSLVQEKLTVSGEAKHEVLQASLKVATRMKNELRKTIPYLNFETSPELVGSTSDGTMVPGQGDCDYLLHVGIPEQSSLEHTGEGYWRMRVHTPSDSMKRLTVEEVRGKTSKHYLSPLKLHSLLLGEVPRIAQELRKTSGVVDVKHVSHQAGPALKFKVTHSPNGATFDMATFDMDFVPCVTVDGRQLVTKRHPSLPHLHEQTRKSRSDPDTLRWRQSFSSAERDSIKPLDKGDGGWSKKLYREVKYLRHNQPQFKQFSSFIYKNVFLDQLEEHSSASEWREQSHEDRFLGYMKKLENIFEKGELNHYFLKKNEGIRRNLLQPDYDQNQIRDFHNFLRRNNREGKEAWAKLLQNIT